MAPTESDKRFVFPRWTNLLLPALVVSAVGGPMYAMVVLGFGAAPEAINAGYQPKQPIPYSHAIHVGQLGIDCRYCHTTVEQTAFAAVPPTATCMNCHDKVLTGTRAGSDKDIADIRKRYVPTDEAGQPNPAAHEPIEWVKVHDLPDFVYFNHAAHVNKGVSCVSCHGRVDQMEVVYQVEPLSMGWCLQCHRKPDDHIRPRSRVTDLAWDPSTATPQEIEEIQWIRGKLKSPRQLSDCSTCHR